MQAMSAAQNEIFRVWLRRHELEALARARMMGCLRQLSLSVLQGGLFPPMTVVGQKRS
jgi:hypothetical protein